MKETYQYRAINANIKKSAGREQEAAFLEIPRKLKKQSLEEGLDLRTPSFPKRSPMSYHYVINPDFLGSIKSNHDFLFHLCFPPLAEKETFPCPLPPRYQCLKR